jgi:hypothetical protein
MIEGIVPPEAKKKDKLKEYKAKFDKDAELTKLFKNRGLDYLDQTGSRNFTFNTEKLHNIDSVVRAPDKLKR